MLVTKAEAAAIFEALKSVLGSIRAKDFFLEGCHEVSDGLIGEVHGPPTRPESGEPAAPRASTRVHPGTEGG